ncbi:MAG: nucleoside triphosphatase [Archaeoglobus sp.]|nr:MAG: nucleoside triphosphatase [Archaeoglobus sp.]
MSKFAITGRPGIGKTTLCQKVCSWMKNRGYHMSGFLTREIRKNNVRIGFEVVDIESGKTVTLASIGSGKIRVGKYSVHIDEFENYLKSIVGKEFGDVVIIDEIGPMELKCSLFVDLVENVISSNVPSLLTLHAKLRHPLLERLRKSVKIYRIDEKNRNKIAEIVFRELLEELEKSKKLKER